VAERKHRLPQREPGVCPEPEPDIQPAPEPLPPGQPAGDGGGPLEVERLPGPTEASEDNALPIGPMGHEG
jgi:hypothetical protein